MVALSAFRSIASLADNVFVINNSKKLFEINVGSDVEGLRLEGDGKPF